MAISDQLILDLSQAQAQLDDLEAQLDSLLQPVEVPVSFDVTNADFGGEGAESIRDLQREIDQAQDEAEDFQRELREVGDEAKEAGDKGQQGFGQLAGTIRGLVGVVAGAAVFREFIRFAGDAVGAASDLEESTSKAQVVFGDFFDDIQDFAATAPQALGLANSAALEFTGTFGNLFTALGLSQQAAADLAPEIVSLGADLASFNNLEVTDALDKLRAGLVGEAEPLRALGVNLNAAAVEAKALELGLAGSSAELDDAAKVQARYALILEQTTNAQGDFARTSDSIANRQRTLQAEFQQFQATVGEALLPAFENLLDAAEDLLPTLESLIPVIGLLGEAAVSTITAFEPLLDALGLLVKPIEDISNAIAGIDAGNADAELAELSDAARDLFENTDDALPIFTEFGRFLETGIDASDFRDLFTSLAQDLRTGIDPLEAAGDAFARINEAGTITTEVLEGITSSAELTTGQIFQLLSAASAGSLGFLSPPELATVEEALQDVTVSLFDATAARDAFEQAIDQPIAAGFPQSLDDIGVSLDDISAASQRVSFEQIIEGFDTTSDFARDARDALRDYQDTLLGLASPAFAVLDAQDQLTAAQEAYNEAIEEGDTDAIVTATSNLAEAQQRLLLANQDLPQNLSDTNAVLAELALQAGASEEDVAELIAQLDALNGKNVSASILLNLALATDALDLSEEQFRANVTAPTAASQEAAQVVVNQTFETVPAPTPETARAAQTARSIIR